MRAGLDDCDMAACTPSANPALRKATPASLFPRTLHPRTFARHKVVSCAQWAVASCFFMIALVACVLFLLSGMHRDEWAEVTDRLSSSWEAQLKATRRILQCAACRVQCSMQHKPMRVKCGGQYAACDSQHATYTCCRSMHATQQHATETTAACSIQHAAH